MSDIRTCFSVMHSFCNRNASSIGYLCCDLKLNRMPKCEGFVETTGIAQKKQDITNWIMLIIKLIMLY